jgi:hypothetical protein
VVGGTISVKVQVLLKCWSMVFIARFEFQGFLILSQGGRALDFIAEPGNISDENRHYHCAALLALPPYILLRTLYVHNS